MEFVLVVPREELFPQSTPHGLRAFGEDPALDASRFEATVLRSGFFVERDYAERTPSLKQVIPYAVVTTPDGVLLTRRLSAGGESRLHDKLSIGIGGHVDAEDARDVSYSERRELRGEEAARRHPIAAAAARELAEELEIEGRYEIAYVGVLNDDTNPVGAVHVGVVLVVTVEGTVAIRETESLEGRLVSTAELRELRAQGANFETWSALLVDRLDELPLRHAASVPSP